MAFTKGKSGNPGGRPKAAADVQALAREHTLEAIAVLRQVMNNKEATTSSRVSAAEAILSRGWGRPVQAVTGVEGGPIEMVVRWAQPGELAE